MNQSSFTKKPLILAFENQKNSDLLFSGDIGSHFKNRYQDHICFADDPDPKQQTKDPAPNDDDKPFTLTKSQLSSLINEQVSAALSDRDKDKKPGELSITEKREQERLQQEEQRKRDLNNQSLAVENLKFDEFTEKNRNRLSESMMSIRPDVEKLHNKKDLSVTVPLMWATLAKEFFSNEQELNHLTKTDQDWVKENVLSKRYETDIDGLSAKQYLERAIDVGNRKHDDNIRRQGGGDPSKYEDTPNLKKRLEKYFPEHVSDLNAMHRG